MKRQKSPKPPRLDGESEDDYYLRLIQELANEKFACYQRELQEKETTNLQSLKKSKGTLKRDREHEDDYVDHIEIKTKTKKKKLGKTKVERRPLVVNKVTEGLKKKVGKTKVERRPLVVNKVTEGLKEFIMNGMNGSEIKLVIQKALTVSDLKQGQNRLNMPANQLETTDFLAADERRTLNVKDKTKNGIGVGILGPNLRMYDKMLELKIWYMPCTKNYVLISNWYNFVKEHHKLLKVGTLIQVWAFRINERLCLALVCPDVVVDDDDDVAFVEEKHDGENDDVVAAASASEV